MDCKPNVDVAILGGGPGGLAAAHALGRRGLSVKVFERTKELRPIGAALGLFPNAYKALEAIDPQLCLSVLNVGVEPSLQILQNSKGDILFQGFPPMSKLKAKYDYPFQWLGWFRLQSVLHDALPPGLISLDHCCTGFTQNNDSVSVHFKGQDSVTARLLVGADGINSVVRQLLLNDGPPRYMGTMSWRAVVDDMDEVCSKGEFRLVSGEGKNFAIIDVGDGFTCWTATALSKSARLSESPEQAKSRVLTEFCGWPEPFEKIVQATDASRIVERGIFDRQAVEHWSQGRVTLLGDAAHPMRPALGQGTGMAFEDAYELSACLALGLNLEEALKKYETERIARTQIIQERAVDEGERAYQEDRVKQLANSTKNWTTNEFDDWLYIRHYQTDSTTAVYTSTTLG